MRKYPTKNPYFLILDLALIFAMAFLIYYSMFNLQRFLLSIVILRLLGIMWSERPIWEYKIRGSNLSYLKYMRKRNFVEGVVFLVLFYVFDKLDPSILVVSMISTWIAFRLYDSTKVQNIIKSDAN